jgi:cell division septation protein DedD
MDGSGAKTKVIEASVPPKKIGDRVPAEETAAKVVVASAPAEEAEKIIAVEEVPVDAPEQAAAEPEATTEAVPAEKISGWSVQLASAASENAAWSTWKKMKARHKALAAKEPVVVRADLGKKGVFYRVRLVGFEKQSDANSACAKLKSKGVRCFISKAAS